jgi:hypothetical protein
LESASTAQGDPYVAGTTTSDNFPTTATNAYQTTPEVPGTHVFVTEMLFDATTLQYSSYLSGNGTDTASGMTIDASGYIYMSPGPRRRRMSPPPSISFRPAPCRRRCPSRSHRERPFNSS